MPTDNKKNPLTQSVNGQPCAGREKDAPTGTPSRVIDAAAKNFSGHQTCTDTLTAEAALAAIETFEIVGENNLSREPNADDRFILTEFIAHLFGGYAVEQCEAAPAGAQAVAWKTGTPPVRDNDYEQFIVAVRRKHDPRRIFVFAAHYANNYRDELRDRDGNEFVADGWYDLGQDTTGEFNDLFMPTLGPDDEVVGWQELPKWSTATSALPERAVMYGRHEADPTEDAIEPSENRINFSGDSLTLSGAQLAEALDFVAPDRNRDQLESELTFQRGDGHAGSGMYCWLTEYPEEGAFFIDGSTAAPAVAAPAPTAQAQADAQQGLSIINSAYTHLLACTRCGAPATWTAEEIRQQSSTLFTSTGRQETRANVTAAARDVLAERARLDRAGEPQ